MWFSKYYLLSIFIIIVPKTDSKVNITLVILKESHESVKELSWIVNALNKKVYKTQPLINIDTIYISDNSSIKATNFCSLLPSNHLSIVIDITWHGMQIAKDVCSIFGIPYIRFDISLVPVLKVFKRYFETVNGNDAVLFFEEENELEQSYIYFFGQSEVRIINALNFNSTRIFPEPSHYALFAHSNNVTTLFQKIQPQVGYIKPEKWILILEDYSSLDNIKILKPKMIILQANKAMCCLIKYMQTDCDCIDENEFFREQTMQAFFATISDILLHFSAIHSSEIKSKQIFCNHSKSSDSDRKLAYVFSKIMDEYFLNYKFLAYDIKRFEVEVSVKFDIIQINDNLEPVIIKQWVHSFGIVNVKDDYTLKPFLRIGVIMKEPWYYEVENENNDNVLEKRGFSLDFIKKLAEMMNFDYKIITFSKFDYGKSVNGSWTGLIGNLSEKYLDIAVTDLVMTRHRKSVVDFITPSFHQIGSLMLMRVIAKEHSLFEFLIVLKPIVWFAILFGLISTSIALWILDKYSPYSARNSYGSNTSMRHFSLRESFWFVATSLTPQGGGEPPQSLSARLLVIIFWIFSVLVLTIFTANFASYLTTEKKTVKLNTIDDVLIQEEVQLIGVNDSYTLKYFKKCVEAEKTIFNLWRNKTLKEMNDRKKYRIWRYPTFDRFLPMVNEMKRYNLSKTFAEAAQRLLDDTEGQYILIHDSDEVMYASKLHCDLITSGSMFAVAPIALAVQKKSQLTKNLTKTISILHEQKFFSSLRKKYWNSGKNNNCNKDFSSDEYSVGFKNFGGIFIVASVTYLLAIISLVLELRKKK